jgi:enamine deaminase RidA (YjgF/YER057c/UK114 family)
MDRRLISSGSPYEPVAGFSRALVAGRHVYVTAPQHWDEVARAHGEVFAAIRPASTCVVAQLLDPRWLVEIEADAILES